MKAISLTQPWATAVVAGVKKWETRSWPTKYRGPLLIHAAKGFPGWAYAAFKNNCPELQGEELVRGVIVGMCDLVDCQPTESIRKSLSYQEIRYGDYTEGRFAFKLDNVKRFHSPIYWKGALGLWNCDLIPTPAHFAPLPEQAKS